MKATSLWALGLPLALLPFAACGEDSSGAPAAGGSAGAATGGAGGSAGTAGSGGSAGVGAGTGGPLPYTPAGCNYQVSAPPDTDAAQDNAGEVGSDPAPLNVHASYASDTSSTFAVNWKTGDDTRSSQLLYGTDKAAVSAADGPGAGVTLTRGYNMRIGSKIFAGSDRRIHEAHVCGLTPDTSYYYKVGTAGHWSEVYDVATGPAAGTARPFKFGVLGDSRDEPSYFAQIEQKLLADGADFQVFTGDLVNIGENGPQWDEFFGASTGSFAAQDALARVPFMPSNGNHDNLSLLYVGQFAVPQVTSPSERGEGEEWYSFDYANAHFVVLNDTASASLLSAQANWMKEDLAKVDRQTTPWLFAVHHRSAYSCSNHGSQKDVRAVWQPVWDQFKVDIVFSGHDHNYERSVPIRGFQSGSDDGQEAMSGANKTPVNESGTLYLVAGGAGAPLYGSDTCYHTHISESTRNYSMVEINGRSLSVKSLRLDGSEIESFSYSK